MYKFEFLIHGQKQSATYSTASIADALIMFRSHFATGVKRGCITDVSLWHGTPVELHRIIDDVIPLL